MHNLILFLGSHFNTCLLEVPFWPPACKPVKKRGGKIPFPINSTHLYGGYCKK